MRSESYKGRSILQRVALTIVWSVYGLALMLGIVYGSKLSGLDLFITVRHSLPPPWCWLPLQFSNYAVIYNTLHFFLIALLGVVYWCISVWRRVLLNVCGLAGSAAAVSVMVVEGLGVREGPRAEGIELVILGGLAFAVIVLIEILLYFMALVLLLRLLRLLFVRFWGNRNGIVGDKN